jgi:hypothetical protein
MVEDGSLRTHSQGEGQWGQTWPSGGRIGGLSAGEQNSWDNDIVNKEAFVFSLKLLKWRLSE